MRINIFFKTFIILLLSFSIVFYLNLYISYQRFSSLYIEENIENVKSSIISSVDDIRNDTSLIDTNLNDLSSETTFMRFTQSTITEKIGPDFISESELLDFVLGIYDSEESIIEGDLTYHTELVDDVYEINYIYEFEIGDYLIISTRVQSLENVDQVLLRINSTQSIYLFATIVLLSVIISANISKPVKQITAYAKDISNLKFRKKLKINRKDEFKDLVSSLNEMTFNLQQTYAKLNEANEKLTSDIDFEKQQEEKKKALIMTINHEVKTPLAVMKGMIEGMIDGVGRYKDRDKYLAELLKQITTIENITQDLTYSLRLEDKKRDQDVTDSSVIDTYINDLSLFASQKKIKLNSEIDQCQIEISEELLKILVSNLVKNAVIYAQSNTVTIKGEVFNDTYIFTVRNKGYIPERDIDQLFNSFYRVKDNNKATGTGLGLYIVRQIAELYNYSYKIFNDNGEVVAKIQMRIKKS